jgi:hypothetical protein
MRCEDLRFSWMKNQVEPVLPESIAMPAHGSIDELEDSGGPEQDNTTNSPKDHLRMAREMKIPSCEMNVRIQKSEYAQDDIYDARAPGYAVVGQALQEPLSRARRNTELSHNIRRP